MEFDQPLLSPTQEEYKFSSIPYCSQVRVRQLSSGEVLHLETLGGRDVQEDEAFVVADTQQKRHAYFILDCFAGETVA
jgi:hypothetical protein